ncbi:hypothetical protein ACG1BZ_09265 [Microbulbifer sp. CNSA002]|uniref:hypothetical protein n=1 Tax=Microbulbifer sp. CNSA002 TaxID=3373604 RepID=UPI0039B6D177
MIYKLSPISKNDGDFAASWFDDEEYLWSDNRLDMSMPLLSNWKVPKLRIYSKSGPTDVLFNPNAYAVSGRLKEKLSKLAGIPIEIRGEAPYYLLHVTTFIEFPEGAEYRLAAGPSGNVSDILSFSKCLSAPSGLFRVLHPSQSAAGKVGFCTRNIYLSDCAGQEVEKVCNGYLKLVGMQNA